MMHRDGAGADRGIDIGIGLPCGTGQDFGFDERAQRLLRADLAEQFHGGADFPPVVIGAEQVLRDAGSLGRIGGLQ